MDNENENLELIRKKVQSHFQNNFLIHCAFKAGYWKNGKVKETSSDFFILDELFDGDIVIFFQELKSVSTYSPTNPIYIKKSKEKRENGTK